MPQFRFVLFSPNPRLETDRPARLTDRFEWTVCARLDEVVGLVARQQPSALVADFQGTFGGGHAEARLLDELHYQAPGLPIVALIDDEAPEPLERRLACLGARPLRSDWNWDRLEQALETVAAAADDSLTRRSSEQSPNGNGRQRAVPKPAVETASERPPLSSSRQDRSPRLEATAAVNGSAKPNGAGVSSAQPGSVQPRLESNGPAARGSVLAGITRRFETRTPQLKRMLADLEIAAGHDVTVLLIGETGSGKTFLSRLIHEVSPRRNEPFLTVACGALPADLIESELFGHVKGAFTSAHADKEGKFVAAGRGTILLDEIDVLAPKQQAKLLRVIETGEFEPVGSNQTVNSQARLVVASNLDLQPLVEQGQFRADLYYRLNMLKFEIPPLRNRKPDLEPLTTMFVHQMAAKHGVEIAGVEDDVYAALAAYPWPGNVRELENVIQRAVIYCRDAVLRAEHLPPNILTGAAGPANDPSVKLPGPSASYASASTGGRRSLGRQVALTEREIIEEALFHNNFSRTNTAKDLGISRVTLYNKMKKYGMSK